MSKVRAPKFASQVIHKRADGYWIDKFYYHKDDKAPGLIVSGLEGKIEYLENPKRTCPCPSEAESNWIDLEEGAESENEFTPSDAEAGGKCELFVLVQSEAEWTPYEICHLNTPVPTASMDITGNGYNDLIVGYNYGATMIDSDPDGGDVIWLENPGNDPKEEWRQHFIGRWPTVHRLAVGYFTQRTFPEVIAAPVSTPIPLIIFQKPDRKIVKEVYVAGDTIPLEQFL
ncbi:hypothetical protein BDW72DRAFT_207696 [Aspergillus terricola var. indicus]